MLIHSTMRISGLSLLGLFLLVCCLEYTKVFAWVPTLRNNLPGSVATPHRRHVATTIYSTIEDSAKTSSETASPTTQRQPITIPMPKLQYTVPGMKRGWKENGVWMDEDGPRNGPPQNFWRQMGDERLHNDSIDMIQDLLKLNSLEENGTENADVISDDVLNGRIERLELTNSIRIPTLNRLILGDWAPILRGGKVIATTTPDEEKSADFPYRFHVQRSAGQKLAPKTHYGSFDEHLEPGEEVTVQELSSSNAVTSSGVVEVTSDKKENKLVEGYNNRNHGDLYLGGITYVTKYVMIMRQQAQKQEEKDTKGPVTEIWMRIDPQ